MKTQQENENQENPSIALYPQELQKMVKFSDGIQLLHKMQITLLKEFNQLLEELKTRNQ